MSRRAALDEWRDGTARQTTQQERERGTVASPLRQMQPHATSTDSQKGRPTEQARCEQPPWMARKARRS